VATLSAASLHIRAVKSLHTIRDIELPRDLSGPVTSLQWSPSSSLLLATSAQHIHVFSVAEDGFHATIRNPLPPAAKPVLVGFGPSDYQICLCASLGLRFAVFDLRSSKAVEIANPKFHATPSACRRGYCFRPRSGHLSILTRISGKDMISIHDPTSLQPQRSWLPDTLDAQGLIWAPDGNWLLTWEAAAHGHKVLFYSSDGNLLRTWSGPQPLVAADSDPGLGPGVKLLEFSADARRLAIGDSSRRICILDMASVTESLRLQHPNSIAPTHTLQVRDVELQSPPSPTPRAVDAEPSRSGRNRSALLAAVLSLLRRPFSHPVHRPEAVVVPSLHSTRHRLSSLQSSKSRQAPYGSGTSRPQSCGLFFYSMGACRGFRGTRPSLRRCS
jgi:WD40 repeat protein